MKILIWVLCIFANALITAIIKGNGVILGGLPTALMFGLTLWIARSLCKKWDEHKDSNKMIKEIQQKNDLKENPHNERPLITKQNIKPLSPLPEDKEFYSDTSKTVKEENIEKSPENKAVLENNESVVAKDDTPRKGIIRMIIGAVLIVLQILSIIGGSKTGNAFPPFYTQNGAQFFYSLISLLAFLLPSIIGIIIFISGYKAPEKEYQKMAKELREKAEKEKMPKDKKATSTQQNSVDSSPLSRDKIVTKKQVKKPFTRSVLISMVLSVIGIIFAILAINFQDAERDIHENINTTILYCICVAILIIYLISLFISKNRKCSGIHYFITPFPTIFSVFTLIEGSIFSTRHQFSYKSFTTGNITYSYTYYINKELILVFNIIIIIISFAILIINMPLFISYLKLGFKKLNSRQHSSIAYKEKCYKKVERMQGFLEKGIITQEEFEENKKQILKKIK